jgi:hypothetical protein
MKRLSTVRMKGVEDTTGNKQSREKSDDEETNWSYAIGSKLIFEKQIFYRRFFKNVEGACKILCK